MAAFDGHAEPKQAPNGPALGLGLAFPRLDGVPVYVQRYIASMTGGIGDFGFTTVAVRMAVSRQTGYLALGIAGLVDSSRRDLDISQTDELGYGPTVRLFLELGVNLINCGLSQQVVSAAVTIVAGLLTPRESLGSIAAGLQTRAPTC